MKIADCFSAAVAVAEQNCREWIFLGNGDVFHADELHEIAQEFDEKMPLAEDDFLAVTDDGSIGLLFPGCKEPDWYFVSPEFAVANVLQEDPRNYIVPADGRTATAGKGGSALGSAVAAGAAVNMPEGTTVFCTNCGAQIKAGSRFCPNCGAKNAPAFCTNCGAKLEPGSVFCGNCGTRV